MSIDLSSYGNSRSGPNGIASCNIFNNELTLECKCSPTGKSTGRKKSRAYDEQRLRVQPKVSDSMHPPSIGSNQFICSNPSVAGSKYSKHEITKQPSVPGNSKEIGAPPVDFVHEKSISKSSSKITLKPLKPPSSPPNQGTGVDTNEMARLYDKYIETKNATFASPLPDVPAQAPATEVVAKTKTSKVALHFRGKPKKTKKKDCLNDNILTEGADSTPPPAPELGPKRRSVIKSPFRFLKRRSEVEQPENQVQEFVISKTESAADPAIEKKESAASDPPTVISGDGSNSIVDTISVPDDAHSSSQNVMDTISVFEVFEQYSGGGAFPGMNCSPRLSARKFEINKQAELLTRIEELQKELSQTKGTITDLTAELDEVYSEKDVAIHKLDRLIQAARMDEDKGDEHEKLREIRMYLTDRTEPTISSITTIGTDHQPPDSYHPFCLCLRSRE